MPPRTINLKDIIKHEDTIYKSFESMCCRLFQQEHEDLKTNRKFHRISDRGGDGGIEGYIEQPNGKLIALQVKFVDTQRKACDQTTDSITTAIKRNPPDTFAEYHVYAPCDHNKDISYWSKQVEKWNQIVREHGYTHDIQFKWVGDHEIKTLLGKSENLGVAKYWFDVPDYHSEWLLKAFDHQKSTICSRYTPHLNIKTNSNRKLDAFFHGESFVYTVKRQLRDLLEKVRKLYNFDDVSITQHIDSLKSIVSTFEQKVKESSFLFPHKELNELRQQLKFECQAIENYFNGLQQSQNSYDYKLTKVNEALTRISHLETLLYQCKLYDQQFLFVQGNAGTGKTHLLANAVDEALKRNQPAVIVLGEHFVSLEAIKDQVTKCLNWKYDSDDFFDVFNEQGCNSGKPAVIAIDAINEGENVRLWKSHLLSFIDFIKNYQHIRLVISCRTEFIDSYLPDEIRKKSLPDWYYLEHVGFTENAFEAIDKYFNYYNIQVSPSLAAYREFSNPLFLKIFCEIYENSIVPPGPQSLIELFEKRIERCAQFITDKIDCGTEIVQNAINEIADFVGKNNGNAVEQEIVRKITLIYYPVSEQFKSLYYHLLSNDIITETEHTTGFGSFIKKVKKVRFTYQRLSDYLIVRSILLPFQDLKDLQADWAENNLPQAYFTHTRHYGDIEGLTKMFSILFPEQYGIEYISLFSPRDMASYAWNILISSFMDSLRWRDSKTVNESTIQLFENLLSDVSEITEFEYRLPLMTLPGHPLNIMLYHTRLKGLSLTERELGWTIPISNFLDSMERDVLNSMVTWHFQLPAEHLSDEQIRVSSLFFSWLLGSNNRLLRDQASRILIKLLTGRIPLMIELIDEFHDCNDPYIVERLYAVACGVGLRENDPEQLNSLATTVFRYVFQKSPVTSHILIRDYACTVIERAEFLGCLDENINPEFCRFGQLSRWTNLMSSKRFTQLKKNRQWGSITTSLRPESTGSFYGDFGRYVMGRGIGKFSNIEKNKLDFDTVKNKRNTPKFSSMEAYRSVLSRIQNLGWTPENFKAYDSRVSTGRDSSDKERIKTERIGKKYQWIAYHEFLGYLSDNYFLQPEYPDYKFETCDGAYHLDVRDFDPTLPAKDLQNPNPDNEGMGFKWYDEQENYPVNLEPCPLGNKSLNANREEWVKDSPPSFHTLIEIPEKLFGEDQKESLTLHGLFDWDEDLNPHDDESQVGTLKMWSNIRCWLVREQDINRFIRTVKPIIFSNKGIRIPNLRRSFFGEYPWHNLLNSDSESLETEDWFERSQGVSIPKYFHTAVNFSEENVGNSHAVPSPLLCDIMDLSWDGKSFQYVNASNEVIARCISDKGDKPKAFDHLIVDRGEFLAACQRNGYIPVWGVLGERSCWNIPKGRHETDIFAHQRLNTFKKGKRFTLENGTLKEIHKFDYPANGPYNTN